MTEFNINHLTAEDFAFTQTEVKISDKKLETKAVGYFQDAFNRFRKNISSVVAAIIIILLILFAIFVPMFSKYSTTFVDGYYSFARPKLSFMEGTGIWDGSITKTLNEIDYQYYVAMGEESGRDTVVKVKDSRVNESGTMTYTVRYDTYNATGYIWKTLTEAEFEAILNYQEETGVQMMFPIADRKKVYDPTNNPSLKLTDLDPNYWYETDNKGAAVCTTDEEGNLVFNNIYKTYSKSTLDQSSAVYYDGQRLEGDEGYWAYYQTTKSSGNTYYTIRTNYHNYFVYNNGFEPAFVLGVNSTGHDIMVRLASGARLSFILAISVSAINLTLGAIYGAIEGYYGGTIDLVMERISDILSGVPFMVVATLFQMHLASKVGMVPSLLFAFVLTGWIGTASSVRMQFYRFKSQEYVLAARTLGAKDSRLIWKHIFPNALGTLVTRSVLVIPGVIFSESMLSYLGIVNLETGGLTSVGSMLSAGQKYLSTDPHIILFPALFISLLEISFNLFGNGLRDAFNPSLRGSEG